ncbi:MAG: signal peptidase II [Lachnospirales bacterium]
MKKRYFMLLLAALILVGADQLVKWWALETLADGTVIDLIPGVFRFTYVENRGAAFGILQGQTVLLTVISIAVTAALLYLYHKVPGGKQYWLLHVCYTLILAGAAGNQIDRIFRGFVVDMFEFYWFRFPVFNLADCFVVVGGILVFLILVFRPHLLDPLMGHEQKEESLDG